MTMPEDPRVAACRQELDRGQVESGAVEGLLDAYEERLRVNVGLVAENAALRQQQRTNADPLQERREEALRQVEAFLLANSSL